MPIEVELPDGSIAEFPDGTARDVMKAAIGKRFAPARAGDAFDAARDVAYQAPQGFNRGLDATINAPYNLVRAGANYFGAELPEAKPIFEQLNSGVEPEGVAGRIAGAVGEAAGSSVVPAAATFGLAARAAAPMAANAGTLTNAGHTMLEGVRAAPGAAAAMDAASVVGSGVGQQLTEEAGGGPIAQAFGALAGGLTPAVPAIAKSMMQLAPQQQLAQNELLEAGHRQGVGIPRAVASGDSVAATAGGISQMPIIGTPIGQGFARGVDQTGERAMEIAQILGSTSKYEAGRVANLGIRDWLENGSTDVSRTFYDAVNTHIPDPAATGGRLANTQRIVGQIAQEQGASTGRSANPALALVEDAIARPDGLTYDGIRNLRTEIGARISGQITPEPGTSQPTLNRLYGALSDDLRQTVETVGGPQALRAFNRANNAARMVAGRREELSRIIGIRGDAPPEKVFDTLVNMAKQKGNQNRLVAARRAIGPENWQEVQSAAIARFGRDKDGNFSAARALSAYGDISEGGRNVLFGRRGSAGNVRDAMDDLVTISRQFDRLGKNFATGSAKTNSMLYLWDKILTGASAVAGTMITSNPALAGPAALTAGGMVAGRQFARYLGAPTTRRAMVQFSRAYVNQLRATSTATRAAFNQAERTLVTTLAQESGENEQEIEARIKAALAGQNSAP